jgi:hypothetical protein
MTRALRMTAERLAQDVLFSAALATDAAELQAGASHARRLAREALFLLVLGGGPAIRRHCSAPRHSGHTEHARAIEASASSAPDDSGRAERGPARSRLPS